MKRILAHFHLLFIIGSLLALNPDAHAKKVEIEWEEIPGAVRYELKILSETKPQQPKLDPQVTRWKGDLKPGSYTYQIRAVDRLNRPGQWSEPFPLIVLPEATTLISPEKDDTLDTFSETASPTFQWTPIPGVKSYRFELENISRNRSTQETVSRTNFQPPSLDEGSYSWKVTGLLLHPSGRMVETEPSETRKFQIRKKTLLAPKLIAPVGIIPPSPRVQFEWKEVEGAQQYELIVSKKMPQGPIKQIYKKIHSSAKPVELGIPAGSGSYTWSVRPSLGRAPASKAPSPIAESSFSVDPSALFQGGGGYIGLSGMMAPYIFELTSPVSGNNEPIRAMNLTGRLSGEYWFAPLFAIAPAGEGTFFMVNGSGYLRGTAELYLKFRASLSRSRFGWFLAPKAGLEWRQFIQLLPGSTPGEISRQDLHSIYAGFGFDLRNQFTDRWSIGAKFAYTYPLALFGAPDRGVLSSGQMANSSLNLRNFSVGLQGFFWAGSNVGLGLGAYYDQRSLAYQRQQYSSPDMIKMDGLYVFGSVLISFSPKKPTETSPPPDHSAKANPKAPGRN